jgi:hypothetical protein
MSSAQSRHPRDLRHGFISTQLSIREPAFTCEERSRWIALIKALLTLVTNSSSLAFKGHEAGISVHWGGDSDVILCFLD